MTSFTSLGRAGPPPLDLVPMHSMSASSGVQRAIARASEKTGVDFSYLMDKAQVESSMNPTAQAKNSSATGLYQFVESTWLQMVRDHGHKYGLGGYAECIDRSCHVKNPRVRQAILDLREDPETSAYMAAEYAAQNADILKSRIGGNVDIGKTELYLAHFLGPGGATKFIQAMERNPHARAAQIFSNEARVNRDVFFNPETGRARTLAQIYDRFAARFNEITPPDKEGDIPMSNPSSLRPARYYKGVVPLQKPEQAADLAQTGALPVSVPAHGIMSRASANQNQAHENLWVEGTPIANLAPEFIEQLLAAPPRLFDAGAGALQQTAKTDATQAQRAVALAEKTMTHVATTSMHQSALLVLAQNFAHEDRDRYND